MSKIKPTNLNCIRVSPKVLQTAQTKQHICYWWLCIIQIRLLVNQEGRYICCHPSCLSLEQSNQHQQSLQAQTTSSDNSESDSDTNTPRIKEPTRQKLTATNSNDQLRQWKWTLNNYEILRQKYHHKKIVSGAEDLSLFLPANSQLSQRKHQRTKEGYDNMLTNKIVGNKLRYCIELGRLVRANQENIRTIGMY